MKKFTLMLLVSFFVLNFAPLKAQVNDDIANAIVIPHSVTWVSGDAEYTTVGATPDMNAASCWNTNPDYNVWFTFQATSTDMDLVVDRGGNKGTIRRVNLAIWESDGTTEVECNRYVVLDDDVEINTTSLVVGDWYYISVDNNGLGHRGTFTLTQTSYDYYEGAIEVPHQANWCSTDAEFSTVGATPDRNAGSCWNTSPDYNVWFKFQAASTYISVTVDRGNEKGTLRRANAAIWESDGLTEVDCNRYVVQSDDVTVTATNLIPGNWYYVSVDNNGLGHRGTFTLCINSGLDYDFYEGAIVVPHADWCSLDAEYTTVGATPDRNAASCWNTSPNYNRWFTFQATSQFINITVDRGGAQGGIRGVNLALWESDGLTEVECNRYVGVNDDVVLGYTNLTVGNWYYISVDNYYSGYRGTFTLCIDDDVDYDYYEGAIVVPHADWCSLDAEYTTVGATPDRNAASCWNTSPNYNRWFTFQATSQFINITVDRGGAQGGIRGVNLALWESDGLTEVECNRYVGVNDDVVLGYTNLTVGNWYYISVDNYYSGYRGTFTLCIDDDVDYDYYEGAIVVPHADWCSLDAEYTTVGATPDRNAASCWNTSPNYNRWFTFQATSQFINITVDRGGAQGGIRGVNLALWESDGLTEVECNRYVGVNDDVVLGYTNLTVGNWYYISVDNYYSGYRGTFTLCIDDDVDYDYYEGAIVVPHADWCSLDAEYTTVGATPDRNAASCWNTSPNYNRWFTFQATSQFINITVDRGGAQGGIRGVNLALWESDGLTEVECNRYVGVNDDVVLGYTNLTVGNWYYISVDNYYSGYRGTFTLCIDDDVDYDYYEGAIVVPHADWCSLDAEYTTVGATPDRNAASCWNTSPNYNRWFTFQATSQFINITVDRGGAQGGIRGVNLALWESDGLTEVECNRYVGVNDDVVLGYTNLTVGNWYYISVDNYYSGYRGTFTLCIDDDVDYDYYEGAIVVPHADWCSLDAEYTTVGATPDRNAASCWNTSPNYNRWFTFQATSQFINITVDRGGAQGGIRGVNLALWESDGLTEVECNRYVGVNDDVVLGYTNLTVGNWYYISVDNYYSGYRGTFTLCIDDDVDYDYYEGAIVVPHADWCSLDAEYTTVGATPDRNAASCWNTSPNYNRWFTFQATSQFINITVDRGGAQGGIRGVNLALWESDGLTEVECNRYVGVNDDVVLGFTNLTVGNWYYISVDNYYSGYRGTFTLCIDDAVDYDYYEGALLLSDISNWCSVSGTYTTVGATPDKNAASCWNTSPNYNRWFKFQASATGNITITVLRGGGYGSIRGVNLALWESDGLTEVACNRYVGVNDNVTIQQTGLVEDNWYYISVDNYYSGYRGSFTLCLDDGRMRWNGNVDDDWDDPGNWSFAYVPTSSDNLLIPSGLTNYPETNTGTDAEANSILMEPATRMTIPVGKALTVTNKFELEADASGMTSLVDQGTLNHDPAKTSYECYLTEDQWHLVSAPVSNAQSSVYLGVYLKYFTEPDSSWTYITALNHNLNVGQGFAAWAASWITGATTVTYNGNFNTGDQSPSGLSYNVGLGFGDGWNLVGNPFPSAVEWNNNWPTNDIDATIYVYDGTSGQYLNWNRTLSDGTMPNGDIPPAQGFWVKANGSSPSVTIPQSERKHSSQGFYKSGSDNVIRLKVTGNGYSDRLLVCFHNAATEEFDSEYDAYKLRGIMDAPQIYTVAAGTDLTLNTLPAEPEMNVPMGFEAGVEGVYTLKAENLNIMTNENKVFLEDLQENKIVELNITPLYDFYALPEDDPDRFNIHILMKEPNPNTWKSSGTDNLRIYSANSDVFVEMPDVINSHIYVYDLMGQLIAEQKGESNMLNKVSLNTNSGIYIIKVIDNEKIYSEKVYIK